MGLQTKFNWILKMTCTFVSILFSFHSLASHVLGGNITYECLGSNRYEITLTVFRDCNGSSSISANTFAITNTCGTGNTFIPITNFSNSPVVDEITIPCAGQLTNCTSGSAYGVQRYQWKRIVELPNTCDNWIFTWSSCCRAYAITNGPAGNATFLTTTLNNLDSPCNSSPAMASLDPIPLRCAGQTTLYDLGVFEQDGDSVVYFLTPAFESQFASVTYTNPFTGREPIQGISMDSTTGQITINNPQVGFYVVAVQIIEYDTAGNILSSVLHDFLFIIQACNNTSPAPLTTGISNITGAGTLIDTNRVQVCKGSPTCFDVFFMDSIQDSIYISSNINTLFPGATLNQINWTGAGAMATICFTAPSNSSPLSSISIQAIDDNCPVGINSVVVAIEALPTPNPNIIPSKTDVFCGDSLSFDLAFLSGSMNLNDYTYNWTPGYLLNDSTIHNPFTDTLVNTTVFEVEVAPISGGCSIIKTTTINVHCSTDIVVTDVACNGFSTGAINVSPLCLGAGPWTINLYDSLNTLVTSTSLSTDFTFSNLPAGNYRVETSYANGCINDTLVSIQQSTIIGFNVSDTATICQNNSVSIQALANGGNGVFNYIWSHNPLSISPIQIVTPNTTTCYTVFAIDALGCFSDTQEICVNVAPPITVQIPFDSMWICSGDSLLLTALSNGGFPYILLSEDYNYAWSEITGISSTFISNNDSVFVFPSSGSSLYRLAVSDNCASDSVVRFITVISNTIGLSASPSTAICQNDSVVIQAIASGGNENFNYNWSHDSLNPSSLQIVAPDTNTCYSVFAIDALGCFSDTQEICVNVAPPITVQIPFDSMWICSGDSLLLTALSNGGFPYILPSEDYNHTWSEIAGTSSTFISNNDSIFVSPSSGSSLYRLVVSDNCASDSVVRFVKVLLHADPVVTFDVNERNDCYPLEVEFNNTTDPSLVHQCLWDFGDGNISTSCNIVTHVYDLDGLYSVQLEVTSPSGCIKRLYIADLINGNCSELILPNIFTPNGDGENDFFQPITNTHITSMQTSIFNRWGKKVFGSDKLNLQWDGTLKNGQKASDGVYFWIVEYIDINQEVLTQKGHVTLLGN